jgi:glycogen(starch) synthase
VVASDIPGYREVVRHDVEGILVPPSDPRRLAAAVSRILDQPELGRGMGRAGRVRAGRYSWDQVAREVEAAYEEALGGG